MRRLVPPAPPESSRARERVVPRRGTSTRYESSKDLHAKHDEAPPAPRPLSDVCCRDADALPVAEPTIPSRASPCVARRHSDRGDRAAAGVYQTVRVRGRGVPARGKRRAANAPAGSLRTRVALADLLPAQTARVPGRGDRSSAHDHRVDEEARIEATLREWLSEQCNPGSRRARFSAPRMSRPRQPPSLPRAREPIELALCRRPAESTRRRSPGIAGASESNAWSPTCSGAHTPRGRTSRDAPARIGRRAPGPRVLRFAALLRALAAAGPTPRGGTGHGPRVEDAPREAFTGAAFRVLPVRALGTRAQGQLRLSSTWPGLCFAQARSDHRRVPLHVLRQLLLPGRTY